MDGSSWTQTIGRVAFVNCDPLFHGLKDSWHVLPAPPAWLTGHLLRKDCIIAPIPAADFASHCEDLLLLPDIAIASNGAVGSVLLFSESEIDELSTVAVPSDSATSVSLLKFLLANRGIDVRYSQMGPDLSSMLEKNDAALLIGDRALVEAKECRDLVKMDLGQEWLDVTGFPMVFGVFAARKDSPIDIVKQAHSDLLSQLEVFENTGREQVVADSSRRVGISKDRIEQYFGEVVNRLDEKGMAGLNIFLSEVCNLDSEVEMLG